jgi:hypothetical protein
VPPSIFEELYALGLEAVKTVADGIHIVIFSGAPPRKEAGGLEKLMDALLAAGLKIVAAYEAYVS